MIRRKQFNPCPLQSYPPILCPIYTHGSMWMYWSRVLYRVSWCSVIACEKSWYKNYWSWCSCSGNIETAWERGGILLPAFRLVSRRGETRPGLLYSSSQCASISPLAVLQNHSSKIYVHPNNYEINCIKIAGHVTIKIYKQKTTTKYYLHEIWEKVPFLLVHGLNYICDCAEKSQEGTLDFLPTLNFLSNTFELILNSQMHHSKNISWEPTWHLPLLSACPSSISTQCPILGRTFKIRKAKPKPGNE